MKYDFQLTYYGTVDDNGGANQRETLRDIQNLVTDSFEPDLMAGVKLMGMKISVDMREELLTTKQELA
jgi:hypothetical protein